MAVDHVIPEYLIENEAMLKQVLSDYGLSPEFDLNSFENWLPAHGSCNRQKHDHIFRPTPLIQLWIDRARAKAAKAREICNTDATKRQIAKALGILATGKAPPELLDPLVQHFASSNSEQIQVGTKIVAPPRGDLFGFIITEPVYGYVPPSEMRLTSNLTIIFDRDQHPQANGPFVYTISKPKD
jgi:hypothetical protein